MITIPKLAKAIQKRLGGTEAEALAEARTVMGYFRFRNVIIDNAILPDDRKVLYALHDAGLLQSFWEDGSLLERPELAYLLLGTVSQKLCSNPASCRAYSTLRSSGRIALSMMTFRKPKYPITVRASARASASVPAEALLNGLGELRNGDHFSSNLSHVYFVPRRFYRFAGMDPSFRLRPSEPQDFSGDSLRLSRLNIAEHPLSPGEGLNPRTGFR